jgi:hypothetical protein
MASSFLSTGGNKTTPIIGTTDTWIVKVDGNGAILWQQSFGIFPKNLFPTSMVKTSDGGFTIAGNSYWDFGRTLDYFLVKFGPEDCDADGVPDYLDQCPDTEPGMLVDANGCGIAQLCPCDRHWKNRGEYTRCAIKAIQRFVKAGLLTRSAAIAQLRELLKLNHRTAPRISSKMNAR